MIYTIKFELIDKFMQENGLSEKKFCKECKITTHILKLIKSGSVDFLSKFLIRIILFTNIDLRELVESFE